MSYVVVKPRNQRVCTRSTKQQLEMCCCYCSVAWRIQCSLVVLFVIVWVFALPGELFT